MYYDIGYLVCITQLVKYPLNGFGLFHIPFVSRFGDMDALNLVTKYFCFVFGNLHHLCNITYLFVKILCKMIIVLYLQK